MKNIDDLMEKIDIWFDKQKPPTDLEHFDALRLLREVKASQQLASKSYRLTALQLAMDLSSDADWDNVIKEVARVKTHEENHENKTKARPANRRKSQSKKG